MKKSMSGYRTIILAIAFSWFFGFRVAHEMKDVVISMVVGPFQTQLECDQAFELTLADMLTSTLQFKAYKCTERKSA